MESPLMRLGRILCHCAAIYNPDEYRGELIYLRGKAGRSRAATGAARIAITHPTPNPPLHQDRVEPAVELPSDLFQDTASADSSRGGGGRRGWRVADDGDQLPDSRGLAFLDQAAGGRRPNPLH